MGAAKGAPCIGGGAFLGTMLVASLPPACSTFLPTSSIGGDFTGRGPPPGADAPKSDEVGGGCLKGTADTAECLLLSGIGGDLNGGGSRDGSLAPQLSCGGGPFGPIVSICAGGALKVVPTDCSNAAAAHWRWHRCNVAHAKALWLRGRRCPII